MLKVVPSLQDSAVIGKPVPPTWYQTPIVKGSTSDKPPQAWLAYSGAPTVDPKSDESMVRGVAVRQPVEKGAAVGDADGAELGVIDG